MSRNDIWLTGPLQVNPYPDCNNGIILDFINQGAFYMARIFNFSAGPAVLPEPVLKKAASELMEYGNSGMSVMEMSHRSKDFEDILHKTEADLREIMGISDKYHVLFIQGGASLQFDMVPMNLLKGSRKLDMVHTGTWTKRAISEAKRYGTVNIIASSEDKNFSYIPKLDNSKFSKDADYFYICTNNTIEGTCFNSLPDTGSVPMVADMSSNILSEVMDVNRFGLIFAGAQKNIGPAGLAIVIVRKDLVGHASPTTPTMLDYRTYAENESMFNTPPTYGIYMAGLVFQWIKEMGGVGAIEEINRKKAAILYEFLDNSKLFRGTVMPEDRSLMNIPFITGSDDLDRKFLAGADKNGLMNLKGHRLVGGMRASVYNAMPIEGVRKLVDYMKSFEKENS